MANGNGNGTNSFTMALPWLIGAAAAVFVWVWGQVNPKVDIGASESRTSDQMSRLEMRVDKGAEALQKQIDELKRDMANRLTKEEHLEYTKRKDMDTSREDEMLRTVARTRVHLDEHNKDMMAITERINVLRDQQARFQEQYFGTANIGKVVDHLQAEIDDLRKPVISAPAVTVAPRP